MATGNHPQSHAGSPLQSLPRALRWLLYAALLLIVVGVPVVWWRLSSGGKTIELNYSQADPSASHAPVKKPSPLGSWESKRKEPEGPLTPPMAIPRGSDLTGGKPLPALPGNAQLDSSASAANDPQPNFPQTPWPARGQSYRAQHKKGFGGCWGELLLGADRLVFTCADNAGKNLVLTLAQITRADDDGVAAAGEKYHFDIPSVPGKKKVHDLFSEWLARTRIAQPAR